MGSAHPWSIPWRTLWLLLLRISGGNVYRTSWARARGPLKHSAREYVCAGISMLGEKLKETLLFNSYVEIYFYLDPNRTSAIIEREDRVLNDFTRRAAARSTKFGTQMWKEKPSMGTTRSACL